MSFGLFASGAVSFVLGQYLAFVGKPTKTIGDAGLEIASNAAKHANVAPSEASAGIALVLGIGSWFVAGVVKVAGVALLLVGVLFSGAGAGLIASCVTIAIGLERVAKPTAIVVGLLTCAGSAHLI